MTFAVETVTAGCRTGSMVAVSELGPIPFARPDQWPSIFGRGGLTMTGRAHDDGRIEGAAWGKPRRRPSLGSSR
jgi:hypothetical protein